MAHHPAHGMSEAAAKVAVKLISHGIRMSDELSQKDRRKAHAKAWRAKNKEHIAAYQKEWKARNANHVSAYNQAYLKEYSAKPDKQFETWIRNLRRNYSMTPDDFNRLWAAQGGKCVICSVEMAPRGRKKNAACIDHNHGTGEVRGLLCRSCNHGIGSLFDDPEVIESAARYLREKGFSSTLKESGK